MGSLIFRSCTYKLNFGIFQGTYESPALLSPVITQCVTESDKIKPLSVIGVPQDCKDIVKIKGEQENTVKIEEKEDNKPPPEVSDEEVKIIRVKILRPSKNVMLDSAAQSWRIEFENDERIENPLIGLSSADSISKLQFSSMIYAVKFCEKNNLKFYVQDPPKIINKKRNFGVGATWERLRGAGN